MTPLQFLSLSPERRSLAFDQAATKRSVGNVIIEKDFKVFGVIDRFSEDVDLSVSPEFVGADAQAFENGAVKR